jgi:hypothetical protein
MHITKRHIMTKVPGLEVLRVVNSGPKSTYKCFGRMSFWPQEMHSAPVAGGSDDDDDLPALETAEPLAQAREQPADEATTQDGVVESDSNIDSMPAMEG